MLAQELEGVRQQQIAAAQLAAELDARVEEALAEKSRAHNDSVVAQQVITDVTREFREAQRKLQEIDRQLAQRTARLKLLQQLQERWEGFGEGAKALLQGRFAASLGDAKFVPITRGLEVKAEYGKAIEALLGSAAEAISVADLATAQKILGHLEADQAGSVCLRVDECHTTADTIADDLPSFLLPAVGALEQLAGSHPAAGVLGSSYIADDLGVFLEYWKANPHFSFLAVATRKGEVVDRRGLIYGGHQSKKSANSIVQREIDLRETARALADEQKAHDDQRLVIDALNARLAEAEQTVEQRRADVLAITQTLAAVQAEQRGAARNADDISNRLARMETELASLEHARNEAHARWEKAQVGLAEAQAAATIQREQIQQMEVRLNELRADRDIKRDTLAQARLELAERRQKVEVLDRGLGEMERRRIQLSELLIQRQHEIETWSEQTAELEQESTEQRERAGQLSETLLIAQQQVEGAREELMKLEREISALEGAQSSLHTRSEAAHDELSTHEIKLAETRQKAQFVAEEVTREYQADVTTLDWKHLLWHADDEPEGVKPIDLDEEDESDQPATEAEPVVASAAASEPPAEPVKKRRKAKTPKGEPTADDLAALDSTNWSELKAEADGLRSRLGSMGAVNLVAIEEYAELKQRFDFLKTQSDDLTTAKTDLLKAIDEINQTSQKQFEVTFEQIRKNFEYTFHTLFGGGRANIELVATDDVLESGIEIVAQPPGTKLKGITLLSGGQKTLTAVALLFALYMVKPSPFCLLDELDAPLDESNIGRFTDLLKKFVGASQFIIITHNKRTVSAASAIYGVTMEERGVSKTVSMRFNAERGEPEVHAQTIAQAVRTAVSA
jgi:chromosome segregation protein